MHTLMVSGAMQDGAAALTDILADPSAAPGPGHKTTTTTTGSALGSGELPLAIFNCDAKASSHQPLRMPHTCQDEA